MYNIVADENIPHLEQYFSQLGNITRVDGRSLTSQQLADADILLVRSVTPVNQELLCNAAVKFVGTATIGIDHLDVDYLNREGIAWANAPGCNANSVVDYIFSCFSTIDGLWQRLFAGASVGIIGRGNVGGCLQRRLQSLAINSKAYDPFLVEGEGLTHQLHDVLQSDVICMHTPLTKNGDYPSYHMLGANDLSQLKQGAVLINAGRGAAIDNLALLDCLESRKDIYCVLDVWEGEPVINKALLPYIDIATPHIAGYSYDGKVLGTQMIYQACCQALAIEADQLAAVGSNYELDLAGGDDDQIFSHAIKSVYDVMGDDQRFRQAMQQADGAVAQGLAFDSLRKHYPERREFSCYNIKRTTDTSTRLLGRLKAAGFHLE